MRIHILTRSPDDIYTINFGNHCLTSHLVVRSGFKEHSINTITYDAISSPSLSLSSVPQLCFTMKMNQRWGKKEREVEEASNMFVKWFYTRARVSFRTVLCLSICYSLDVSAWNNTVKVGPFLSSVPICSLICHHCQRHYQNALC